MPLQTVAYLQPHNQGQILELCRLAVSIIQPPEHVGPISHFHIVPGLFTTHRTGESCKGCKQLLKPVVIKLRPVGQIQPA